MTKTDKEYIKKCIRENLAVDLGFVEEMQKELQLKDKIIDVKNMTR